MAGTKVRAASYRAWLCIIVAALLMVSSAAFAAPPTLSLGGKPFFPIGWYSSANFASVEDTRQYLAEQHAQGMNAVLGCYGNLGCDICDTNKLEAADLLGMKDMIEVHRWAVMGLPGYPPELIDHQVNLGKGYPALMGWYLIDEPELQGLTPAQTQVRYAQVKGNDPDHPISVVHAGNADPYLDAEPPPYTDIVMTDNYLCVEGTAEFANPLWRIARTANHHVPRVAIHGKQAYFTVIQTHQGWGLRMPTYAEQRYISYAPVVFGSRGLYYWMYDGGFQTEEQRVNVVGPIAREIKSLIPAILSDSTAVSISSDHDTDPLGHAVPDVAYLFGEDTEGGYVIAVNNTPDTISVNFELWGDILAEALDPGVVDIPVLFESRTVALQPTSEPKVRALTDTMTPYDVNVYRLCSIGDAVSIDLGGPDVSDGMTNPQSSDGNTVVVANQDGRNCKRNSSPADLYFYFGVSDSFAYQGSSPDLFVTFDYYDTGSGSLELQYDATDSPDKSGGSVALTAGNTWKRASFHVTDAYFGNRQNAGADFRISGANGFYLDTVRVSRHDPGTPIPVVRADPTVGVSPLTVNFDGSGSSDPDGVITAYAWDFDNDGLTDATGPAASHVYAVGGTFTPTMTVTDAYGLSSARKAKVTVCSPACYSDKFAYADGNLNGNGGWSGTASSQITIENQTVKISGGAGSFYAARGVACEAISGVLSVSVNVKRGSSGDSLWNFYIDDPAGKNIARWWHSGWTVQGCVGAGNQDTPLQNLSGYWDNLRVDIYPASKDCKFYLNSQFIGKLNYTETGASGAIGSLKFERLDDSGAEGEWVHFDDLAVIGVYGVPSPVGSFSATPGPGQVTLSWTNPSDVDFAGTIIRYKFGSYPTSQTDGNPVCDRPGVPGSSDSYTHIGFDGVPCFYAAFAYDYSVFYSAPQFASATASCVEVPLNEAFDDYSSGDLGGQGSWITTGSASAQVQASVTNGGSGKAALMDTIASGGAAISNRISFLARSVGYHYVSVDVCQNAVGTTGAEVGYVSFQSSDSSEIAKLHVQKGRFLLEYGSGTYAVLSASIANNTWYNVKIGFNVDTRKMDAWLDGVSKGINYGWKGSDSNISRIVVSSSRTTSLDPQQMYVDNLKLERRPGSPAEVRDDGNYTPGLSKLHFSFDPVACAGQYQYAIGTTSGGTQTRAWTSCGQATDVMATGLSLADNQTYYVSVQVGNSAGAWGASKISNGVKVAPGIGIQSAKALSDGTSSSVKALRGKLVSAEFAGCFYVQDPGGPFGIKIVSSESVDPGDAVDVCGVMCGSGLERYLDATGRPVFKASGPGGPDSVILGNASLGGANLNGYTPGVVGGLGPNNVGLLVTAYGKVTQRQTTDPKYFYIDDGCGLKDGTTTAGVENVGVRVLADPSGYAEGSYVAVTGISSCFDSGGLRRQILATEISVLQP
ncbi:MAG: PKD domain-containing protein [Armatimonadota bacterium]|nr:PKD domain-containing protein [Armatimonadota bacterium]